jgi:hypothetical protein
VLLLVDWLMLPEPPLLGLPLLGLPLVEAPPLVEPLPLVEAPPLAEAPPLVEGLPPAMATSGSCVSTIRSNTARVVAIRLRLDLIFFVVMAFIAPFLYLVRGFCYRC